jgi:RNA polymerase sigma factor (sigma-70 family)
MDTDQEANTGEDDDFGSLVYEVLAGHKRIDELLSDLIFERRLRRKCRALTENGADAEDLFNDVCLKLIQVLLTSFQPDFTSEALGFPSWLHRVTVNCLRDQWRKQKLTVDAKPVEEHSIVDPGRNVQEKILQDERYAELVKCIKEQPRKEVRLAAYFYVLKGLSAPDTVEQLSKLGIDITAPTVRNWVRDALTPYFPQAIAHSISELARKENTLARGKAKPKSEPRQINSDLQDQEKTPERIPSSVETQATRPKGKTPVLVRKKSRRSKKRSEEKAIQRPSGKSKIS